jgi:hypothetical protein
MIFFFMNKSMKKKYAENKATHVDFGKVGDHHGYVTTVAQDTVVDLPGAAVHPYVSSHFDSAQYSWGVVSHLHTSVHLGAFLADDAHPLVYFRDGWGPMQSGMLAWAEQDSLSVDGSHDGLVQRAACTQNESALSLE